MDYQTFKNEVQKMELLQFAQDDSHTYKAWSELSASDTMEKLIDVMETYFFPVFRSFEMTRAEQFSLLRQMVTYGNIRYFTAMQEYYLPSSGGMMTSMNVKLNRNISNGSESNWVSEPVTIDFGSNSMPVPMSLDLKPYRNAAIDSLILHIQLMI